MTVTLGPIAQNPGVEATNGTGTKRDAKDWKGNELSPLSRHFTYVRGLILNEIVRYL